MHARRRHQPDRTMAAPWAPMPASLLLLRSIAGLALAVSLGLGCFSPGTFQMVNGPAPGSLTHVAVNNRYEAPADVYLRMGSMRIHLLHVPATSSAAITIPPALAGLSAHVIVWVHGEQPLVSVHEVLLAADTRLELIVSPANQHLHVARRS